MAGRSHSMDLTPRQVAVLTFIKESIATRGYAPSYREIAAGVGLKTSSAADHQLEQLVLKGYITRDPRIPRSIVVLPQATISTADSAID